MIREGLSLLRIVTIDSRKVVPLTIESSIATSVSVGFTTPRVMSQMCKLGRVGHVEVAADGEMRPATACRRTYGWQLRLPYRE